MAVTCGFTGSNREVARTLVRSERTVESHVRSILAKTGLTTRTELTRWYLQQPRADAFQSPASAWFQPTVERSAVRSRRNEQRWCREQ
jgi:hypothetical protein